MRLILAALLLVALPTAMARAFAAERVELNVPYVFTTGDAAAVRRKSLDLYVPAGARAPPLAVFVHGGFWTESDDKYGIGPTVARALGKHGAAVALVRYRLAPDARHPAQAEDLAAALAFLKNSAARYGYDRSRIFLIGHSTGAHLASLVALDRRFLLTHGMTPADLAGVVAVSGVYDVSASGTLGGAHERALAAVFGSDPSVRRSASPMTHARAGPPFLVLSASDDAPGFQIAARRFALALTAGGHRGVQEMIVRQTDHFSIIRFEGPGQVALDLIAAFLQLKALDPLSANLLSARQRWQKPPFSTEAFWHSGVPVRSFAVDGRLRKMLERIYEYNAWELRAYPLKQFHAIDLSAYLDKLPADKAGRGDYLTMTNIRGGKSFWRRRDLEPYKPVLVVGLDDERNLFRLTVFYQNRLEYSWKPERPPIMARPVGGFVYFLKEPPAGFEPDAPVMFALTPDSFQQTESDPLAPAAGLPAELYRVMKYDNACFSCHSFRGAGARAGHVTADSAQVHGGFALALESYPPDVWRRFMLDPDAAAARIGVRPNAVNGPARNLLHDIVVAEREKQRR